MEGELLWPGLPAFARLCMAWYTSGVSVHGRAWHGDNEIMAGMCNIVVCAWRNITPFLSQQKEAPARVINGVHLLCVQLLFSSEEKAIS